MTADEASLHSLTGLLTEFYSGSIKPDRRTAIQQILFAFEQTPSAWYTSLYYLFSSSDQYVALYCLGVVEKVVLRRWTLLDIEQQTELRRLVQCYLFQRTSIEDAHFLIKKAAKIIASIASLDWPHAYPNFLEDVKAFISTNLNVGEFSKVTIGLFILRVFVEQLLNPHEVVTYQRKRQLRELLVTEAQSLYSLLLHTISKICGEDVLSCTYNLLHNSTITQLDSSVSSLWRSIFQLTESLVIDLAMQSSLRCMTILAWLECFSELLKVLPLDTDYQIGIYSALYVCSLIGSPAFISACTSEKHVRSQSVSTDPSVFLTRIGLCALSCIQEIVERKDLSTELMMRQLWFVFPIVQSNLSLRTGDMVLPYCNAEAGKRSSNAKVGDSEQATELQNCHNSVDDTMKLVDILRYLMANFFFQISDAFFTRGATTAFDPMRFLGLLHDFTFASLDLDTFTACLSMWSSYLEFVRMRYLPRNGVVSSLSLPHSLRNTFIGFGRTLLCRLFFSDSAGFLETFEDTASSVEQLYGLSALQCDSDDAFFIFLDEPSPKIPEPSEYCSFMRESLSALNITIELVPQELVNCLLARYYNSWNDYITFIQSSELLTSNRFIIPSSTPQQAVRTHWILRDYATSLHLVGYLLEHLRFFTQKPGETSGNREFLQSLVYGLQIGQRLYSFLPSFENVQLRNDLVGIIVQNLLTLQAIVVGNYLCCESASSSDLQVCDKFLLSTSQRDSLVFEVFSILEHFIFSQTNLLSIQLCAARLFNAFCACPMLSTSLNLYSVSSSNDNVANPNMQQTHTVFRRMFDQICDMNQRDSLPRDVLRILLRTFIIYLSFDSNPFTSTCTSSPSNDKSNLLQHLVTSVFLPYLSPTQMQQNSKTHLAHLGLLDDALRGLESSGTVNRRTMNTVLLNAGVLDAIVTCTTNALEVSATNAFSDLVRLKFCTAYLTFFTTYIRLLSQFGNSGASVPQLLCRLVGSLDAAAGTRSIPVPLLESLLDIFLQLSQNRRTFALMIADLLGLCQRRVLVGLTSCDSIQCMNEGDLTKFVCDAAQQNGSSMEKLIKLLFAMLVDGFSYFFTQKRDDPLIPASERFQLNNPSAFHLVMSIITAMFHEGQTNPGLVGLTLQHLQSAHQHRKLYDLPTFKQLWLPEICRLLLNCLLHKRHDSCKDDIVSILHQLLLSTTSLQHSLQNGIVRNKEPGSLILQFFTSYLDSVDSLTPDNRTQLLSHLAPLLLPTQAPQSGISDLDAFSRSIEQLVTDLRHFRMLNTENGNTGGSNPAPIQFEL